MSSRLLKESILELEFGSCEIWGQRKEKQPEQTESMLSYHQVRDNNLQGKLFK